LLVSYNFDATESYGKSQGTTGPVSGQAAFEYCVALNRLLDRESGRRAQVGDATTVFWTAQPSPVETWLPILLDPPTEDDALLAKTSALLSRVAAGQFPAELGSSDTPLFLLGLSANAARLSVRFWLEHTVGDVVGAVGQHFADLEIAPTDRRNRHPAPWQLLRETARESKNISPQLSGSLLRSILMKSAYSQSFLGALLRRMRADRGLPTVRAAAIKACLNRDHRLGRQSPLTKELPVSLNPDRPEPAYQLGRLFACLEKVQEDALPGINDTIKDRYFSAASTTPATVFPRLIRLSQHHLGKLTQPAFKVNHERRLQEICGRIEGFPPHLAMAEQGAFAIGYYHQRQDLFKKRPTKTTTPPENEE
jgi:CRISPR-associated protein Csd1